jgi:hypothetical protein
MPHRDYDEAYTGGLTLLHAAAFRLFGTNLVSLRIVLFLFFLFFVAALFGIARRLVSPLPAVLVTLLCVAWSVPNYFASLPSWYNLFFATFGALALMRYLETGRRRWIFLAGLCGGVSVVFKIVGLYFIAAALLFLAYRESNLPGERRAGRGRLTAFFLVQTGGCVLLLAAEAYLLRDRIGAPAFFHFLLPTAAVAGLLLADEWKIGGGSLSERLGGLVRLSGPFLLGVAVPVAVFVAPFVAAGALSDLARGVFLLPQKQIATAAVDLPPLRTILPAVPYALVLAFPRSITPRAERGLRVAAALFFAGLLGLALLPAVHRAIWYSARSLLPLATVAGCYSLAKTRSSDDPSNLARQRTFLLLCLAALIALVQFPFAAPIYFCYVAPLTVFAIASVLPGEAPRALHLGVAVFYLLFAVLFLNPVYVFNLGYRHDRYVADRRLQLDRGGIRLPEVDARKYERLIATIEKHGNGPIYAGPDCPEIYFLSDRPSPTRTFFEFLGPLKTNAASLVPFLETRQIRLVVLNRTPAFSAKPALDLVSALKRRYPNWETIDNFVLLWKK